MQRCDSVFRANLRSQRLGRSCVCPTVSVIFWGAFNSSTWTWSIVALATATSRRGEQLFDGFIFASPERGPRSKSSPDQRTAREHPVKVRSASNLSWFLPKNTSLLSRPGRRCLAVRFAWVCAPGPFEISPAFPTTQGASHALQPSPSRLSTPLRFGPGGCVPDAAADRGPDHPCPGLLRSQGDQDQLGWQSGAPLSPSPVT